MYIEFHWLLLVLVTVFVLGLICMYHYDKGYGLTKEEYQLAVLMVLNEQAVGAMAMTWEAKEALIRELDQYAGATDGDYNDLSLEAQVIVTKVRQSQGPW
jgi:hypothetical protein